MSMERWGGGGGGDHGDGGVACDVIPVNNTYINICTIKSILVNNTAEDAKTQTNKHTIKQKHPY